MPQALLAAWLALVGPSPLLPAECRAAEADPAEALGFLVAVNAERHASRLPPLRLAGPLCAVAAERARAIVRTGTLEPDLPAIADIAHGLDRRGYHAHRFHAQPVERGGAPDAVLAAWRGRDPGGFAAALLGDVTDLGIGRTVFDGTPLRVLLVALPAHTVFQRQAAALGDLAALRTAVLAALNAERQGRGLAALRRHPQLERAAQAHAEDLRRRSYYDHRSPEGSTPRTRLLAAGYDARVAAENLAKGFFAPAEVVARWMLSSEHRANILGPELRDAGIGWALDADRETALWVADFAAGGPPP